MNDDRRMSKDYPTVIRHREFFLDCDGKGLIVRVGSWTNRIEVFDEDERLLASQVVWRSPQRLPFHVGGRDLTVEIGVLSHLAFRYEARLLHDSDVVSRDVWGPTRKWLWRFYLVVVFMGGVGGYVGQLVGTGTFR